MEMVSPNLELGKEIWALIRKYYNYHRRARKDMEILKNKWEELERRKSDVEKILNAQLEPGKSPLEEVNAWLQRVESMKTEIQNMEQEAGGRMCFSRMQLGKLACKKIQKVEELYKQRDDFNDSLVVNPPVSHGETIPTTTLVGETTAKRTKEKVWEHLLGENFSKIGVYGMGGIGKSTITKEINNDLLKERDKFDYVIWVTLSKASSVFKLQHVIACKLNLDLTKIEDETTRACKLNKALEERKRYVLILDDMWEEFPLHVIGIPEPTPSNGCKLVLTTRNVEVCNKMDCENIKMELLSKDESLNLFLDTVGHKVLNIPDIKPIVEDVVKECACLPLAIITIAGSLKKVGASEWRDALNRLRTTTKEPRNLDAKIFETLQISYERLKDEKLQRCLLCCALYLEDYEIYEDELIEHLIDEEVIESMKSTRQAQLDRGHTLLRKLEKACVLEGGSEDFFDDNNIFEKKHFVKMHDLIRDMALQIAGAKFLVLEDVPSEEEWGSDVEKVSLMGNHELKFPYESPKCPKLSALLLKKNLYLPDVILDSFFVHLHGLRVLHVYRICIEFLPNSVSDLKNLTSLRLNECFILNRMPSLAKLTALRRLDISISINTGLEEIPNGLEMLVKLRYLNLCLRMSRKLEESNHVALLMGQRLKY